MDRHLQRKVFYPTNVTLTKGRYISLKKGKNVKINMFLYL